MKLPMIGVIVLATVSLPLYTTNQKNTDIDNYIFNHRINTITKVTISGEDLRKKLGSKFNENHKEILYINDQLNYLYWELYKAITNNNPEKNSLNQYTATINPLFEQATNKYLSDKSDEVKKTFQQNIITRACAVIKWPE